MASRKRIATHNGSFHCDEVLAVHILRHTAEYAGADVVRSRDPAVLAAADAVVDVGEVYDFDSRRFDHHQRNFDEVFSGFQLRPKETILSSAGLVYRHFGREAVGNILAAAGVAVGEEEDLRALYYEVYDRFVEAVDAIDNGIRQFQVSGPPRYYFGSGLSARVGEMNTEWNEPSDDEAQAVNFAKAMAIVGVEFDACVEKTARTWLPLQIKVAQAMAARREEDMEGRVLVLLEWPWTVPWTSHILAVEDGEAEQGERKPVKYVVCKGKSEREQWRMSAVKDGLYRTTMPEAWRRLQNKALEEVTAIDGCTFCDKFGVNGGI